MRHLLLLFIFVLGAGVAQAQWDNLDLDGLKAAQAEKMAMHDAAQADIDALQGLIDKFPGWKFGGYGTLGLDGLFNNNWFALPAPNSRNGNLSAGLGGFARLDQEKVFWHNSLGINVVRNSTFADKDDDGSQTITLANNALDFTSLAGYKLAPKWALSAEVKWLSTVLERGNTDLEYDLGLNKPGVATLSAGATWLPMDNLTVNIHPLGYQKNWPGGLSSMAGCKIGASYLGEIIPGIAWKSDLSCFIPYSGSGMQALAYQFEDLDAGTATGSRDYSTMDLANWTWINSFTLPIFKGIAAKFDIGVGQNRQQANLSRFAASPAGTVIDNDDPFQSYFGFGLGYTFL